MTQTLESCSTYVGLLDEPTVARVYGQDLRHADHCHSLDLVHLACCAEETDCRESPLSRD